MCDSTGLPSRVITADWSGAITPKKKIWLAKVGEEGLGLLENAQSREEVCDFLLEEERQDTKLVVGLDFAFSFPSWFIKDKGCMNISEFWEHVTSEGENWIENIAPPFFTKGGWTHESESPYRLTECELRNQGWQPETVFKLIGQNQVGRASIRGMPIILKLRRQGFNIWPFDPPEMPLVVEIYPRLFYGKTVKTRPEDRHEYLSRYSGVDEQDRINATSSDDAFDAAVSALEMFVRRREFLSLRDRWDDCDGVALEGWIWP